MKLINSLIFFSFIMTFDAIALDSKLRVTTAQPTTTQNLDISELTLSYLHSSKAVFNNFRLYWYPAISLSSLNVNNEKSYTAEATIGVNYPLLTKFNFFTEGGLRWLQQYQFGQRGEALKNYGGHWQYIAKVGLGYKIQRRWSFGYAYEHMSNGNRYTINPALNVHSLYVSYQF